MSIVQMFLTGTYSVSRKGAGTYRKGRYVPGSDENIVLRGSLQPMNARELKMMSEGMRIKQLYKFYSDQPLQVVNTQQLAGADVVTINGETFKVISTESWAGTDIPYFKSILVRQPEQ